MNFKNQITVDSNIRQGKPCIRGTRITTEDVLEFLASGKTVEEILKFFPRLTEDDVFAALVYGLDGEEVAKKVSDLQLEITMSKTPQERAEIAAKMTDANRQMILHSLPKDLSEEEIKQQLYFRVYGEHLPDDFFERQR